MSKNANVTVADAVAQAAEEKLVTVPQQNTDSTTEEKNVTADEKKTDETPELKVVDGEKKTLGQRLDAGIAKLRENRKTVLIAGASITAAAVAFAKFARKQVEEVIVETTVVTTEATDENTDGESAA
uniref:Holin n=1 Tax=Streptomyces phage Scarif TaxID=3158858 RepID=A0AAU7GZP6_9CAUD